MKYKTQKSCPCGDYEFTLVYHTDNGKVDEFFCPFCGHLIDNEPNEEDEESDDD